MQSFSLRCLANICRHPGDCFGRLTLLGGPVAIIRGSKLMPLLGRLLDHQYEDVPIICVFAPGCLERVFEVRTKSAETESNSSLDSNRLHLLCRQDYMCNKMLHTCSTSRRY